MWVPHVSFLPPPWLIVRWPCPNRVLCFFFFPMTHCVTSDSTAQQWVHGACAMWVPGLSLARNKTVTGSKALPASLPKPCAVCAKPVSALSAPSRLFPMLQRAHQHTCNTSL